MNKKYLMKFASMFLLISFVFSIWSPTVLAATKSGDLPEFDVVTSNNEDLIPHWLHIVVYEGQWYITPKDACENGGFKEYKKTGDKYQFLRPYFIVGKLDPDDTKLGSNFTMFKNQFSVEYSDHILTYKNTQYLKFNSVMNTLRTTVSYDSYRGVVTFEPCSVFPKEIDLLCTQLINDDDNNVATAGPLVTVLNDSASGVWDFFNGGESDEEAVLKAIVKTPAYNDSKLNKYFHSTGDKKDYIKSLFAIDKALNDDGIEKYATLWSWAKTKNTGSSTLDYWATLGTPDWIRTCSKYYNHISKPDFERIYNEIYPDKDMTYTLRDQEKEIKNTTLASWYAYKDYQRVRSWNGSYMAGLEMAFFDGDISDSCPLKIVVTARYMNNKYNANDYELITVDALEKTLKQQGKDKLLEAAKKQLLTPYSKYILALTEAFGAAQAVSEGHQTSIVAKIQSQCRHRNTTLGSTLTPANVMGQKYVAILHLRSYIYSCSLWEDGTALSHIADHYDGKWPEFSDEEENEISRFYSKEIDRVAPILSFLIQIDDNEYMCDYDNKIGNAGATGKVSVPDKYKYDLNGNEYTYTINIRMYHHDKSDFSNIANSLEVNSRFFLGEYEQDNNLNNGPEPIEWIVQEKDTNGVKASSVRILDSREFKGRMWFNSDLRRWCNHEFLETAFADYEIQRLDYMQFRGGRNDESQSKRLDYSSVDRVLLYNTGAAIATAYANRNLNMQNTYWCSREGVGASGEFGHQYVKEDGEVGFTYYYQDVLSRVYGIKPYIDISFDPENDAKKKLYANAVPGDLVTLGKDELDGNADNGFENIDWIVMGRSGNKLFLETYYPINGIDEQTVADWKSSPLREWLNNDFYNGRLTDQERGYIVKSTLQSPNGYATEDYLFPQNGFARFLEYSNYNFVSAYTATVSLNGITNPLRVCTVISLDGETPDKHQVEGMYISGKSNLSDSALSYKVGDSIYIGNYEQDMIASNGRESIEWIVLEVSKSKALVISKHLLDYKSISYDWYAMSNPYSSAALKNWLTTTFKDNAFSEDEKQYINGDVFLMDNSQIDKYLPVGNPNRTAMFTHYALGLRLKNTSNIDFTDLKDGKYNSNMFTTPRIMFESVGSTNGEYWALNSRERGRISVSGELVGTETGGVSGPYYVRPAMWVNLPETLDVSTEQQFIAALTDSTKREYTINILSDFSISEDLSELTIYHGNIQFNGHTLTFEQKGNDDYLYFGGDDSVAINLEGGDEPGSAIKVDSSFMGFLLRNPSSTINSVKIYIGDNEQKPGFVNVVNEKQFITALTDSSNREYTVNIVSDFVLATDLSNTKINHGNVNFNGHTLKITSKGNGDYYYFGGSDSVIINLDGGENGSVIRLDSSYSHFALRNKKSTFKNIKIYIGNNQQTAPAPTDTYEVYDCYPLEIVFDENKLVVTNKSDVTINDWAFRLTFEDKINSLQIYSGQPFEISEDKYSVVIRSRTEWHQVIAPGESLEVSLNLNDFHTKKPSRIELVETDPIVTNDLHKITVSDTQNGYVVLSKYSAKTGEKITVTAIPDEGYVIGSISINGSAITGTTFTLGDSDATVDVIFTNAQFTVTVNKPANGSVSIDKETAHFGETITVTVTPEACYELDFIKVNGEPIEGNTFTMPEKDVTIEVAFKAKPHELTCIPAKSATCTEDGYEAFYKCSGCGKLFSDAEGKNEITEPKVIKALGHSWDEGTATKEPTCEETGSKLFKCTRDGCTESKTEEIAALGHHLVLIKEKAPTKTEPGNISYYKCDREGCGKLFSDAEGKHEISLSDAVIPVMVHELTLIKAKDATCTEIGNTAYYVCKDTDCGCGKVYSDKYGQHEIKLEDTVISAKGHSIIAVDEKKATCTEDGYASHFECSNCHKKFSDSEGKTEINAPEVYPKLGHSWDEGEVTTQPGCETEGVKTFHCTREGCKSTKEEPIPALGHDKEHLKHVKAKGETYDEDGNIEYYICERCGIKFADPDCKSVLSDAEIVIPKKGAPELGDLVEIGNFKYQVTSPSTDGTGTLTFKGVVTRVASVSVPATVTIKESSYIVNRIGTKAFYGDKTLKTVYIGNNVVIIDSYAFYGCSNLVKVSGGKALKTIGTKAFAYCSKLKSFSIASSVLNKIGSYAFQKDKKLKTIYIRYTTKITKSGVKKSLKKSYVKTVKVKKSKVKKYKKYFKKSNSGRSVKVKK